MHMRLTHVEKNQMYFHGKSSKQEQKTHLAGKVVQETMACDFVIVFVCILTPGLV